MNKDWMKYVGMRAVGGAIGATLLAGLIYILLGEPEVEEVPPWEEVKEETDGKESD